MATRLPVFHTPFSTYRAIGILGEGGSGRVYAADDEDGNHVAVKLLTGEGVSREKARRFKNEILFGSRNRHRNIVAVLDHGLLDAGGSSRPFYVMRRYSSTLRHAMAAGVPAAGVLKLFSGILDGVEAAHLLEVVHRDIKPENILLDDSTPLIGDFGIARFSEGLLATAVETKPTTRLANFLYAAPEQRHPGKAVDTRADIFALGLILNEMYTGSVPQGTGYVTVGSKAPAFAYLDDLVAAMIAQRPDQRPSTIGDVKEMLIARGQVFVATQKLDTLKRSVVPATHVDDPVARDPIRVLGGDWDGSRLIFSLSQSPPRRWAEIVASRYGGAGSFFMNYPPESIQFSGSTATWNASEDSAQQQIEQFKGRVTHANTEYVRQLEAEAKRREQEERQRLQDRIAAEERRQRVAKKLQF